MASLPSPCTSYCTSSSSASGNKPVVKAYVQGTPDRLGVQTEKGRVIYVFRNGDRFHAGYKMTVHSTKYKTMDQARYTGRTYC